MYEDEVEEEIQDCILCQMLESFSLFRTLFEKKGSAQQSKQTKNSNEPVGARTPDSENNTTKKQSSADMQLLSTNVGLEKNTSFRSHYSRDGSLSRTENSPRHYGGLSKNEKAASVVDFLKVIKAGMMKARTSQSSNFKMIAIENHHLCFKENSKQTDSELLINISDILKVSKSKEKQQCIILTFSKTLTGVRNDNLNHNELYFQTPQETTAFYRGMKSLLRSQSAERMSTASSTPSRSSSLTCEGSG